MTLPLRIVVLGAAVAAAGPGCASLLVSADGTLALIGYVYDDPGQAVGVTVDSENALPAASGVPVAGCDVTLARRTATAPGRTSVPATDRSDAEGHFSVFMGRDPGPFTVLLTVECSGFTPVEYAFEHSAARQYRAAVFVARTR
jgi:hypothetical protein